MINGHVLSTLQLHRFLGAPTGLFPWGQVPSIRKLIGPVPTFAGVQQQGHNTSRLWEVTYQDAQRSSLRSLSKQLRRLGTHGGKRATAALSWDLVLRTLGVRINLEVLSLRVTTSAVRGAAIAVSEARLPIKPKQEACSGSSQSGILAGSTRPTPHDTGRGGGTYMAITTTVQRASRKNSS